MSIFHSSCHFYAAHDTRYVFLDGAAGHSLAAIYQSLQAQLSIPAYFGHNLDALEEVLADTEWVPEKKIAIILLHSTRLLEQEPEKRRAFLEVLHGAPADKIDIYHLGTAVTD